MNLVPESVLNQYAMLFFHVNIWSLLHRERVGKPRENDVAVHKGKKNDKQSNAEEKLRQE